MSSIGQIERKTQQRVVKLFRDTLGYDYLGDCRDNWSPSSQGIWREEPAPDGAV